MGFWLGWGWPPGLAEYREEIARHKEWLDQELARIDEEIASLKTSPKKS
jgi:hypothetical protein